MVEEANQMNVASTKRVILFGASDFARLMTAYIEKFTDWLIEAYTVDGAYVHSEEYLGKPLVPFERLEEAFSPASYEVLVAIGYKEMGDVRKRAFERVRAAGYAQPNFIHPTALCYAEKIGEGNIILENAVVSILTTLGSANLIWNGCQIGHDLSIGSYNSFGAGVICAGETVIGDNCFFGVGSATRNNIDVASYTLLGAGCYLNHSTSKEDAYIPQKPIQAQKMTSRKILRFFELSE